jgi:hypothetical protein
MHLPQKPGVKHLRSKLRDSHWVGLSIRGITGMAPNISMERARDSGEFVQDLSSMPRL